MSADLNKVFMIGRLTRDSELKYTAQGTALNNFSIAVGRREKRGNDWVDAVSFFDVTLWGKQAEALAQYLTKGTQVAIDGRLEQRRWTQDGQNRSAVSIVAESLQLLGSGKREQGAEIPESSGPSFSDDIPF